MRLRRSSKHGCSAALSLVSLHSAALNTGVPLKPLCIFEMLPKAAFATVRSKLLPTGGFEATVRSKWLPQGAFEATVRSKWPPRVPGCPRVASRPLCAQNGRTGWLRGHCALDLVAHRGCLQGHCTLWSSPRSHRGTRACVCAAKRSEKLFEASMLGFTEPCITALCCTLHRAWVCTG